MTQLGSTEENTLNSLKCHDDPQPVQFEEVADSPGEFVLSKGNTCSWAKSEESFQKTLLRSRIEPWLTALCQSEHLSLLLGSGLSNGVHQMATGDPFPTGDLPGFSEFNDIIDKEATRTAEIAGRDPGNIEDLIRSANQLIRGLAILGASDDELDGKATQLSKELDSILGTFVKSITAGEYGVISGAEKERGLQYLVSFLMSFASRSGTRDRLHVFTTNYDRTVEAGAELAGLHLIDRFTGSLAPVFRASRLDVDMHYNPPGIRGEPRYVEGVARFTKLHGSLDWIDCQDSIRRLGIPFGARKLDPFLENMGLDDASRLLIYPNSAKDRETAEYPYVELFRDFAAAICRPNHTLVSFGYGFGDEHINRVLEDMLTIPSTHLVVMGYDDPMSRMASFYDRVGRHAQLTLMVGPQVGALAPVVDHYLPKPAIDRTTIKMAELLKARWSSGADPDASKSNELTP